MLVTALNGVKVLALRPDYFSEIVAESVVEVVEEVIEEAKPSEEELAEIAKQKLIEEKKAELAKLIGE